MKNRYNLQGILPFSDCVTKGDLYRESTTQRQKSCQGHIAGDKLTNMVPIDETPLTSDQKRKKNLRIEQFLIIYLFLNK